MKVRYALIAAILALATPAMAQSGTVTYEVGLNGVSTVTVNYTNRTITTQYDNGMQFTQASSSIDFNAAAAWYAQQYGEQRQVDGD